MVIKHPFPRWFPYIKPDTQSQTTIAHTSPLYSKVRVLGSVLVVGFENDLEAWHHVELILGLIDQAAGVCFIACVVCVCTVFISISV